MAEENTQEPTLVIDAVDNVSRGIADHYLIRESQGYFKEGTNIILDSSGRPRIHDGQRILIRDSSKRFADYIVNWWGYDIVDGGELEVSAAEGLFSLDNKLLVCIVKGKFYYYSEERDVFLILNKQLFPVPELDEKTGNPKVRRFNMVKHNNSFVFVCIDEYYRPVVIYLKDEGGIDGHYLGVPAVALEGDIKATEGILKKSGVKEDKELYHYAFCFYKQYKTQSLTRKEYGPLTYLKKIDPETEKVEVSNKIQFDNGTLPPYMENSSYELTGSSNESAYRNRYYFIKEGTFEVIVYLDSVSKDHTIQQFTYRYIFRNTTESITWAAGKFLTLVDPSNPSSASKNKKPYPDFLKIWVEYVTAPDGTIEEFPVRPLRIDLNKDNEKASLVLYRYNTYEVPIYMSTIPLNSTYAFVPNDNFEQGTATLLQDFKLLTQVYSGPLGSRYTYVNRYSYLKYIPEYNDDDGSAVVSVSEDGVLLYNIKEYFGKAYNHNMVIDFRGAILPGYKFSLPKTIDSGHKEYGLLEKKSPKTVRNYVAIFKQNTRDSIDFSSPLSGNDIYVVIQPVTTNKGDYVHDSYDYKTKTFTQGGDYYVYRIGDTTEGFLKNQYFSGKNLTNEGLRIPNSTSSGDMLSIESFHGGAYYWIGWGANKGDNFYRLQLYIPDKDSISIGGDSYSDSAPALTITPSYLGYNTSDKTRHFHGTASWGTMLYVLITEYDSKRNRTPKSKILIFDVNPRTDIRDYSVIFRKALVKTIVISNPDNKEQQVRWKIGVTWSHIFIIESITNIDFNFIGYNRYTWKRDENADYEIRSRGNVKGVKPDYALPCYMAPKSFVVATNYYADGSIRSYSYSAGYRNPIYSSAIGTTFYDEAQRIILLSYNEIHSTTLLPEIYRPPSIIGDGIYNKLDNAISPNAIKNIELIVDYKTNTRGTIQWVFVLFTPNFSNTINTTTLLLIKDFQNNKLKVLLPPEIVINIDKTNINDYNRFTGMSLSTDKSILYVWMETKTDTTIKNTLRTYNVGILIKELNDIIDSNELYTTRDDKDVKLDTPILKMPVPLDHDSVVKLSIPPFDTDDNKLLYNAPNTSSWGQMGVRVYRKDPNNNPAEDIYKFLKDVGINTGGRSTLDLSKDTEIEDDNFPTNANTTLLYAKLKGQGYDGDVVLGLNTAPSAKNIASTGAYLLLGDVKLNGITLNIKNVSNINIYTNRILNSSSFQSSGFPVGNKISFPHNITYLGGYKSHIIVSSNFNLYRINRDFSFTEIDTAIGVAGPKNAVQISGVMVFISDNGIYTTDGFNVYKINEHLNEYFKRNIQGKHVYPLLFLLKNKLYFFYKSNNNDAFYNKGLIIDLHRSSLKTPEGAFCTEYNENTYLWPQETNLQGTAWAVHKNNIYKTNFDGSFSVYDDSIKEKEVITSKKIHYHSEKLLTMMLPQVYRFISGGLSFQSTWRKKHISRISAVIDAKSSGSLHIFGISEGGKSRIDLKDINVPSIGVLQDDTTFLNKLSLQKNGVYTATEPLGSKYKNNVLYQVGFENGLYLEHSGGKGQWKLTLPPYWSWSPETFVWTFSQGERQFLNIDLSKITPAVPRRFKSPAPFLNYIVVFKNIVDLSGDPGFPHKTELKEVFKKIQKNKFFLSDTSYPVLDTKYNLINIINFNIKQNLSVFIDTELALQIKDPRIFNPSVDYLAVEPPDPPDPDLSDPYYSLLQNPFFPKRTNIEDTGVSYGHQGFPPNDIFQRRANSLDYNTSHYFGPISFEFDLYSYSTMDFQLLSLTVKGSQGMAPNPTNNI